MPKPIKSKIIYGYVLVLGVSLIGTMIGLNIGNYYQEKTFKNRQNASNKYRFLSSLQIDILYNRPTKQLAPYLDDSQTFIDESTKMFERIENINTILENIDNNTYILEEDLIVILDEYKSKVNAFSQEVQNLIQEVPPLLNESNDQAKAEDLVVNLAKSREFQEFIEFPNQLTEFSQLAKETEQQAEISLIQAENLRKQIIFISIFISVIFASIIVIYTSRIIAFPIQTINNITQKITTESNFNLQVDIKSNDEIGTLADSFNNLIQEVQKLLSELNSKNEELQTALTTLKKQQLHLIQSEKMSSLGQLVAGIAHEINNPINFIYGNINYIEEYTQNLLDFVELFNKLYPEPNADIKIWSEEIELEFLQEDLPNIINSIKVGTNRVRDIVISLRNFSRLDESELKAVDIHEGIDNTILILKHRLKQNSGINIIKKYSNLPLIKCYPGQLNQVFMNILANAIDALENKDEEGEITIKTSLINNNQWVKISIIDNGEGIPQSIKNKIFDPFFTTKPIGKGTGMGMAISYQIIIEKHGGKLSYVSTQGKGTEFIIEIPNY